MAPSLHLVGGIQGAIAALEEAVAALADVTTKDIEDYVRTVEGEDLWGFFDQSDQRLIKLFQAHTQLGRSSLM